MRIASWNVNGLRSLINSGHDSFLDNPHFDVICIQEVKMQENLLTPLLFTPKNSYWNCSLRPGYSGVATIVGKGLVPVTTRTGIGEKYLDEEGRVLTMEFERFVLVNVYAPHSHRKLTRLAEKERFIGLFLDFVCELRNLEKPIIIAGDLNAAHQDIDLHNYRANRRNAGFLPQERKFVGDLISMGFVDAFRFLYPQERRYSWWGFVNDLRERDIGWRIDYILVDASIKERISECLYIREQLGSDHCPVIADIDI